MTRPADGSSPTHAVAYRRFGDRRALVLVPLAGGAPRAILTFLHGRGEAAGDGQGGPLDRDIAAERLVRHGPAAFVGRPLPEGEERALAREARSCLMRYLILCPQLPLMRQWRQEDADWVAEIEDRLVMETDAQGA